jgi:CBS domain-containing protein
MQVREIMTRSVETIAAYASLKEAARKMESEAVGFLPVLDEGELVGVITDRDITVRAVSKGFDPEQTTVEETMTSNIVSLPENSEIEDASDLMEISNVRRLVITDKDDAPVGVVSLDKVAFYLGIYGTDNGLVRDTREFPDDFEPSAQAGESAEGETTTGTEDVESTGRSRRDQGDPRRR